MEARVRNGVGVFPGHMEAYASSGHGNEGRVVPQEVHTSKQDFQATGAEVVADEGG